MLKIRPSAVAGRFYPGHAGQLTWQVAQMMSVPAAFTAKPAALVVPHAGYIYSGPVAASAYATLASHAADISNVVLLGPCHTMPLRGLAVSSAGAFATPLGQTPLNLDGTKRLLERRLAQYSDAAHQTEHSLEVQLPFLQNLLGEFTLLPIVVGNTSPGTIAEALSLTVAPGTLIVISSDLSHYHPYATAIKLDATTTQAIEERCTTIGPDQACGYAPLNGLLLYAIQHQLHVTTLDVRNSGDTAGPRDNVVGYGAYALH